MIIFRSVSMKWTHASCNVEDSTFFIFLKNIASSFSISITIHCLNFLFCYNERKIDRYMKLCLYYLVAFIRIS